MSYNVLFTEPRREISASCQCKNFVIPSLERQVCKENNSFAVLRGIYLPSKNYVSQIGLITTISLSAAAECLLCFLKRKQNVVVQLKHRGYEEYRYALKRLLFLAASVDRC